jgi:dihydrofolate reductase
MLHSTNFLTLDGVVSDPHVWHPAYASDESLALLGAQLDAADGMVLGRRTYEELASYWPQQGDDVPLARRTNAMPKHVVTSTLASVDWTGAAIVPVAGADVVDAVRRLAQAHGDLLVPGSITLTRALLAGGLLDGLRFYLDPLVAGHGERLFAPGAGAPEVRLELVDRVDLPHGVVYLAYRPVGEPRRG